SGIGEVPVELLGRDSNNDVAARRGVLYPVPRARTGSVDTEVETQNHERGNQHPGKLARCTAAKIHRAGARALSVSNDGIEKNAFGDDEPASDNPEDQPEDVINRTAVGGNIGWQQILQHGSRLLLLRL